MAVSTQGEKQFQHSAPILNDKIILLSRESDLLRQRLTRSLSLMLKFYGAETLKGATDSSILVRKSAEYRERSLYWLTEGNHNYLRITRILTYLMTLGLEPYAKAFFDYLHKIYQEEGEDIGEVTYHYGKKAIS